MSDRVNDNARYKRPESVLVLVYARNGEVLLLHRRSGFWQSVTGALNWGESPEEAAVRELAEETGLSADGLLDCRMSYRFVIYPIWRHRYASGVVENKEHVFRLELDEPTPVSLDGAEHDQYVWVGRDRALAHIDSHTNSAAVQQWVPEEVG